MIINIDKLYHVEQFKERKLRGSMDLDNKSCYLKNDTYYKKPHIKLCFINGETIEEYFDTLEEMQDMYEKISKLNNMFKIK